MKHHLHEGFGVGTFKSRVMMLQKSLAAMMKIYFLFFAIFNFERRGFLLRHKGEMKAWQVLIASMK